MKHADSTPCVSCSSQPTANRFRIRYSHWGWPTSLPLRAFRDPAELGADGPYTAAAALEALASADPAPVVFPALHGPFGEDGQGQSLLESAGLVYCGAGPAASAC